VDTGQFLGSAPSPDTPKVPSFTEVFATKLIELAKDDDRIVAITAGMPTGTGLDKFEAQFKDRFFDVGICEQHAVTFAAGLAARGMRPVAAIYSTFLQRAYDQFIHDVCLQNLPVVFAIDRAGLVGEDSPTQQGAFDISFLRAIPNFTLFIPRDDVDLELMLAWALKQPGPVGFRFARGKAQKIGAPEGRDITRGEILRDGTDAYFLATGPSAGTCLKAAKLLEKDGVSVGVADARRVKPLDTPLIDSLAGLPMITVEENTLAAGFGSAVLEHFEARGRLNQVRVRRTGIPDRFLDHMTREEQLEDIGLDAEGLARTAREFLGVPVKAISPGVPLA
jgi:1-deoxy-D-xylulose-5-phosphate synthase